MTWPLPSVVSSVLVEVEGEGVGNGTGSSQIRASAPCERSLPLPQVTSAGGGGPYHGLEDNILDIYSDSIRDGGGSRCGPTNTMSPLFWISWSCMVGGGSLSQVNMVLVHANPRTRREILTMDRQIHRIFVRIRISRLSVTLTSRDGCMQSRVCP